ncbi:MAG: efflux transporter outer membrane subunit [Proteobacteria bacterium]|nr:efflux transporter outer membrane subunit [Pseudomonadota bacterium]MBU1737565.1 efflux transporter outer membrane subunit [Pseudomonadota bacterium]
MKRMIPLFLIAAFLPGCSVYDSKLPELLTPLPEAFVEGGDWQNAPDPGRFWEQFNDPDLNGLVEEALEKNLSIRQAQARYEQFAAQQKISRASLLPFLNLTGGIGADDPLTGPDGTSMRLSAVAGYELDLWNKLGSDRDKASFNLQASAADLKTAMISTAAQVSDLYFLLIEQRAQLELSDRIIASQADTLARMESRYEAGLVAALDVYQARQNILAARAAKPPSQTRLAKGTHALAALLGRFPDPELGGSKSELLKLDDEILPGIPSELLTRRPDIEAALARLKARDAEVAAAAAERFPAFNLTAVLGTGRLDYVTVLSDTFWSLLLEVVQPVFDNGRRRAEIDRRQAVMEEELARYHQVVIAAVQEVEDAIVSYRNGLAQLQLLEERHVATTDTLRLAEDQYFEGLTEYLSVLTAQVNHFTVQQQLLSSRRQLLSDRISLYRALGGDWMGKSEELKVKSEELGK